MKRRIGIVTLPLHTNYGGILQAYALQEVLRRMGYEPLTFERPFFPKSSFFRQAKYFVVKSVKRYLLNQKVETLFPYKRDLELFRNKERLTRQFVNQYINTHTIQDFEHLKNEYQCLIVGSDQVWRPKLFGKDIISHAYLSFAKDWNVRRIAFSASFGTDEWEYTPEQTKECGELLQRFDAVSVRESSAISLVKDHFNVDAIHVLDPTMLLLKEDYEKLVANANVKESEGDLFCYVLDEKEEVTTFINQVATHYHLVPFSVGIPDNLKITSEQVQPPVEQWLRGFMDARMVITDSFHACVFSIIFHKPFIVVGNEERGNARFDSLLSMFELQYSLVENGQIPFESLRSLPTFVYEKLRDMQKVSMDFLRKNMF